MASKKKVNALYFFPIISGVGVLLAFIAVGADWLGIGGYSGFGLGQALLVWFAVLIIGVGLGFTLQLGLINKRFLQQYWQYIISNKIWRSIILTGWLIFWVLGFIGGVEWLSRQFLELPAAAGQRPLQPYLMNGDFYDTSSNSLMLEREGPTAYDYELANNMLPVYSFDKPVVAVADRFEFLFQDRASLASDKNSDAIRIFVIGGSAAQGTGASIKDNRYYVLLEKALTKELGKQVHIIPAAMGGYISTQERIALELAVLPHNPDLIIIFDGFNDAALPAIFGSRPGDPYNLGVQYQEFYTTSFLSRKWFIKNSHLYSYLFYNSIANTLEKYRQNLLQDPEKTDNYAQSAANLYIDNLTQMSRICHQATIPCLIFLQPARALTWRNQNNNIHSTTSMDLLTLRAYDAIRKQSSNFPTWVHFVDLTSVFDTPGEEKWFYDWVHFDDRGHQRIASEMYPYVFEMLHQNNKVISGKE